MIFIKRNLLNLYFQYWLEGLLLTSLHAITCLHQILHLGVIEKKTWLTYLLKNRTIQFCSTCDIQMWQWPSNSCSFSGILLVHTMRGCWAMKEAPFMHIASFNVNTRIPENFYFKTLTFQPQGHRNTENKHNFKTYSSWMDTYDILWSNTSHLCILPQSLQEPHRPASLFDNP